MSKHIIVTVEFSDQLAATNKPVDSITQAISIIENESCYPNTIQAYAWNRTNGNRVVFCLRGPAASRPANINIDTLVEGDRI